jgi:hypothetical protein
VAAASIYFLNMAIGAVCLGWNTSTINAENFSTISTTVLFLT